MAVSASWDAEGVGREVAEGIEEGLFEAAEMLLGLSDALVPLDEGTLMNTGTAHVEGATARIGYNTPYARVQHEDLTLQHPNGRQAKYLEQPLNHFHADFQQVVGAAIERRLNR